MSPTIEPRTTPRKPLPRPDAERKAAPLPFEDAGDLTFPVAPTPQDRMLVSIAISLKRIADAMETNPRANDRLLAAAKKVVALMGKPRRHEFDVLEDAIEAIEEPKS